MPAEIDTMISPKVLLKIAMKIRRASSTDSKWILHHRIEMFKDMGESEEMLEVTTQLTEKYLESDWMKDYLYFLVEEGEQVIGGCGISTFRIPPKHSQLSGVYAYLSNMFIEPEFRRKGVGTFLVKHVINFCKEKKIGLLLLHASDTGSLLYKSLGFDSPPRLMEIRTYDFE